MDPRVTLWLSGVALIVSIASLTVSIIVAFRNARIQRAQIRTDVLSKLFDLRLEYAGFLRRITKLKENPPSPVPKEIESLLSAEAGFRDLERKTESYRQALLGPKQNLGPVELEQLRHHTEALVKQLADDNKHLDDLLDSDPARRSVIEQFNALKRQVLYVSIVNELPVELNRLRAFLIEKGLVEETGVREFFAKWLANPVVIMGIAAVNVFSNEGIEELRSELDALQL